MARVCEVTGKRVMFGNRVSHANNRTRRKFGVNLHMQRFFVPELKKWVSLKVSAAGIKKINKCGISSVLKSL